MLYSRLILVEINFKVVSSIRELRELIRKKIVHLKGQVQKVVEPCVLEGSSASRVELCVLGVNYKKKINKQINKLHTKVFKILHTKVKLLQY